MIRGGRPQDQLLGIGKGMGANQERANNRRQSCTGEDHGNDPGHIDTYR